MSKRKIDTITGTAGTVVLYRDAEWQEYVAVPQWNKEASYHTSDKQDCYQTAHAIANNDH